MTREEIFNELKDMIVDNLGIDEDKISMETSLAEDLGADSLDVVELIMEIEEAYDFEISDEDAENMTTIGDAVTYIEESQK